MAEVGQVNSETKPNQIVDKTKVSTPATLKNANNTSSNVQKTETSKGTAEVVEKNPTTNGNPERALTFLKNVDNGTLYNEYKQLVARAVSDKEVVKNYPIVLKLLNLPNYTLPDILVSIKYNGEEVVVNEDAFVKTIHELSVLAGIYLTADMNAGDKTAYQELLNGVVRGLSILKEDLNALYKETNAYAVLDFVRVVDAYLKAWEQFKSEYPDPDKLKEEVVEMADATTTQTTTQAGSIFSNLLDAVYGILGSIVDALKNYATEIAEVLVAGMLGYSVIRYGRQMINGLVNMVSALF